MGNEQSAEQELDLGRWLGRREAFSHLSGRCSAADVQCLQRMRDDKGYVALGMNWEEFCKKKIGVSRATADRLIRQLVMFGPQYFELAAVLRIAPEEYRQIAPSVTEGGVVCGGETIEISADNATKLALAVESLSHAAPAPAPDPVSPSVAASRELRRALNRARKASFEAVESYGRALQLATPDFDRGAIRREMEKFQTLLILKAQG